MPARKNITRAKHFFFIYESTISNACKEKYHKSQTFFFAFTNLQFQMPARKNITRAKLFFFIDESTISNAPYLYTKSFKKNKKHKRVIFEHLWLQSSTVMIVQCRTQRETFSFFWACQFSRILQSPPTSLIPGNC